MDTGVLPEPWNGQPWLLDKDRFSIPWLKTSEQGSMLLAEVYQSHGRIGDVEAGRQEALEDDEPAPGERFTIRSGPGAIGGKDSSDPNN